MLCQPKRRESAAEIEGGGGLVRLPRSLSHIDDSDLHKVEAVEGSSS